MPSLPNDLWWEIIPHAISPENNLAMVKPSSERLYPFFPGSFSGFRDTHFYSSQLAIWKRNNIVAHSFVQVNRLWRGIAERFLYSAFYAEEEWRVQRLIDTIKLKPKLAKQLRTLVIMPRIIMTAACFDPLVEQVLGLCDGIVAIVMGLNMLSSPLPLFQSLDSSRPLLLLSVLGLQDEEFTTFMIHFNNFASLQVLELSVTFDVPTFPSFPKHITFPSLHTLILGDLPFDMIVLDVIGKWELPSLKELSISQNLHSFCKPLLPLIQRSYDKLEFFNINLDLLRYRAFLDITRAPPVHLRNVTLDMTSSAYSSPPIHPAAEPFFGHIVTLGVTSFGTIRLKDTPAWVRFLSDPNGIPVLDAIRAFEKVLENRGVAFKGVMDDYSSFIPIKVLQRDILEHQNALHGN